MEPTTEIAAYNTKLEADLVVALLGEAGIEGLVIADNLGGAFPMMQMITGGYKVRVLETVADEATEIIAADEAMPEPEPRRSAISRLLSGRTPTQVLGILGLLAASIAATLYAVTQGPL